jgi:uncharacterized protein YdhG (YjbR/CyaY superfamily)
MRGATGGDRRSASAADDRPPPPRTRRFVRGRRPPAADEIPPPPRTRHRRRAVSFAATSREARRVDVASDSSNVDEYLASLPMQARQALEELRSTLRDLIPDGEECLSYGMPAVCVGGKAVVGYAASSKHCSLHPMDGTTVAALSDRLAGYETSKGTIRFAPETPLPRDLIVAIVDHRLSVMRA